MINRLAYVGVLLATVLALLAVWVSVPGVAAADPDYTIMVVPDTQYLVFTCSSPGQAQALNILMNWIKNNKNANLGNTDQGTNLTLNTKAVIGLGDITQQGTSGEFVRAAGDTVNAYGVLDANSVPFCGSAGNHDWTDPTTAHTPFAAGFVPPGTVNSANCASAAGFFSASCRAVHGYFGGVGGSDTASYGGSFDEGNYYIRLTAGAQRMLIYVIEYQPRSAVLAWAKSIHDANPGWANVISTHSFQATDASLTRYSGESGVNGYNNDNGGGGLSTSQATSDANFNSGYSMWNSYLSTWSNLTMVLNGHLIAVECPGGGACNTYAGGYHYSTLSLTSSSSRAQTVQSIFTNWQDFDAGFGSEYPSWNGTGGNGVTAVSSDAPNSVFAYCNTGPVSAFRLAHVMILQFRPSLGTVEGYIIATTNGKWEPTRANYRNVMTTTPQLLFTLPYTGVPAVVGAATGRGAAVSAGTVIK
jgi:hypothetical protein